MKRLLGKLRLKNSLLSQYLLIVLCALILLPISLPVVTIAVMLPMPSDTEADQRYRNGHALERMWHEEAERLGGKPEEEVREAMEQLHARYPESGVYRVDRSGRTLLTLGEAADVPEQWTPSYTVQFMKARVSGDPFTVVAFVGGAESADEGFIVMEVPRSLMVSEGERARTSHAAIFALGTLAVLGLFLFFSLLFFYRIRRRLVRLQAAMASPAGDSGIPLPIEPLNEDEIGRLERSFNAMIRQLTASRAREAEEESLRKDLVAKLSHDLRTPLTAIRGHAYSLREETLTAKGHGSVELIERKIEYLGRLIDNLFSYSLLAAGKYPFRPRPLDIVRAAREWFAGWYPVFEQEGFDIELDMPDVPIYWEVDPEWLERILDNYCQNVLRHAREGRYIGLAITPAGGSGAIAIADRGPGLSSDSKEKGAGLGLSIAALMLKEMRLRSEFVSGRGGTTVTIDPYARAGGYRLQE